MDMVSLPGIGHRQSGLDDRGGSSELDRGANAILTDSSPEIAQRLHSEIFITQVEIPVG
jgi:hypothetical protein